MKHIILFLSLAASVIFTSCKKDKAPNYGGAPNAISGHWVLDAGYMQYPAGTILPEWGFGTDYKYEKKRGLAFASATEQGTYSLAPGPANGYTLTLKPRNGNSYTVTVTEISAKSAYFKESADAPTFIYLRK